MSFVCNNKYLFYLFFLTSCRFRFIDADIVKHIHMRQDARNWCVCVIFYYITLVFISNNLQYSVVILYVCSCVRRIQKDTNYFTHAIINNFYYRRKMFLSQRNLISLLKLLCTQLLSDLCLCVMSFILARKECHVI